MAKLLVTEMLKFYKCDVKVRQQKTATEKLLINTNLRISTDHRTLHIRQHKLYICNCQLQ